MTTAAITSQRRQLVRKLRANKFSQETIILTVNEKFPPFAQRTFYRDLAIIKKEAAKWARELYYNDMPDQWRLSLETIEARQTHLATIANDPDASMRDKIEADKAIIEAEITRINLLGYADTIIGNVETTKKNNLPLQQTQ